MIDFVRLSAAIDRALPLLDAAGLAAEAEALRVQGPELMRLARVGRLAQAAARIDPQPTPAQPATDPIVRKE